MGGGGTDGRGGDVPGSNEKIGQFIGRDGLRGKRDKKGGERSRSIIGKGGMRG